MTIKAGASTPTGTYAITVTGTGKGIPETANLSLTVNSPVDSADPREALDNAPTRDLRTLGVGSSGTELIPEAKSTYCPAGCWVLGKAASAGYQTACTNVVVYLVGDGCLALGRLAGPCLLAGLFAGEGMIAACATGAGALAQWVCNQFCTCPRCQIKTGAPGLPPICVPTCQASEPGQPGYCPPPGFCDPNSCGCATPTCPPGDTPCGTNCCSYVNAECLPYIGNGGALTCFPAGSVPCSDGDVCLPGLGTPLCCVSPDGYKYGTCCYGGEQCCQIPYATWCCPATTSCGTSYLSCVT